MNVRALFETGDVIIGQINHVAQSVQRLLHVIDFLWHHFYLVDSAVERQRDTVTVVNNAAAGRDRHQLNAVFIRASLVVVEANNLHIIQVGDKHAGQQQNPKRRPAPGAQTARILPYSREKSSVVSSAAFSTQSSLITHGDKDGWW